MSPGDIKRLYFIIRVFLKYGLDELIPQSKFTVPLKVVRHCLFWLSNKHKDKSIGARLRLALETLGPVWVKCGQMLSTRRDLIPTIISDQLALLQDNVASFDGRLARQHIEQSLGGSLETWFDDFDEVPLASASIAQVHTAKLKKNNQQIVIKIIRPNILPIIQADIGLMYRIANWIPHLPGGQRLRPREVVREYEKTLIDELNLLREAANAIQLRRNFKNSSMLYIPKVYSDYCRENIMVMERIYGIPVSDVDALKQQGINMKLLAERGVKVFFTQVFRDSFFHADMHPGNIFISREHPDNPQYIGIDCGIVGSLNKEDKRYLAENFIAFFNRDYRKVAELHIDSGWVPADTNVEDFEFAIRTVCEPIFEKPIAKIYFSHVLFNLFNTARRFNMEVQPQLVLLQKTLLYIEGLGKQLYLQLDLWKTAKPFLEDWLHRQIGLSAMITAFKERAPYWAEKIPEIPDLIYGALKQHQYLKDSIYKFTIQLQGQQIKHRQSQYLLGIGATCLFCGTSLQIFESTISAIIFIFFGIIFLYMGWYRISKMK
ncbi:MAG: ubiquinone biosynthesis regulatory protein kinase UbiB [Candidatus Arsenophonus melophagi]|nr:ubiquinone biosynthesis regulatory protein kinase UbiB [Candidatus Arsenophonus melophagi]